MSLRRRGSSPIKLSLFTIAAALALATAPSAHAQDAAQLAEAKKHMEAGAAFYNDPNGHKCEEALKEFKKAYDLSGSLNALKAMGVCELELERDGDAIGHFDKFLEKLGDKPHPDRAQVETDLKALKSAVAWITIAADRPNVTVVDVRTPAKGYPITNRYVASSAGIKIGVHPGQHVFKASSEGVADIEWKVDLSNGATQEHTFEFDKGKPLTAEGFGHGDLPKDGTQPAQKTERPIPVTVYIFGGLTAALVVPTAIFMVTASGKKSDFDDANGKQSKAQLDVLHDDVQSANLVADIFLGATVASAAGTAIFYLTRPEVVVGPPKTGWRFPSSHGPHSRWTLAASAGPKGGSAVLRGAF